MKHLICCLLLLATCAFAGMKQLPGQTEGYWYSPIRQSVTSITLRAFVDAEGNALLEASEVGIEVQAAVVSYDLPLLVEALLAGVALMDSIDAGHSVDDQLLGDWRVDASGGGQQGVRLGFAAGETALQSTMVLELADYRRASKKVNPKLNRSQAERLIEILQQAERVQRLYLEELRERERFDY